MEERERRRLAENRARRPEHPEGWAGFDGNPAYTLVRVCGESTRRVPFLYHERADLFDKKLCKAIEDGNWYLRLVPYQNEVALRQVEAGPCTLAHRIVLRRFWWS